MVVQNTRSQRGTRKRFRRFVAKKDSRREKESGRTRKYMDAVDLLTYIQYLLTPAP